ATLTFEEAAAYTGIGMNKLREMARPENCPYALWVGKRRLIKRKPFEQFLERSYSV
ncbi:MAG: excisionase, partial [Clostridia bacterium]|nr:excisionase [Clostridia bacterium]